MIFEESNIHFRFSSNWMVHKYDEHPFYSSLSGAGFKAVDFIALHEYQNLYLWEIKNYNRPINKPFYNPWEVIQEDPQAFVEKLVSKVEHTIDALRLINLYYQRKWFYKRKVRLLDSSFFKFTNWFFWLNAHRFSKFENKVIVVICLSAEEADERFREWLLNELHNKLKKQVGSVLVIDPKHNFMDIDMKPL
ncbi:MAG: hypothetical protein AAFO07_23670 [Bacteroidota bacterium]